MTMNGSREKCVLIAAGGTGGHVIPGVEVAKELRDRGWECVFIGTSRGFENRLVPQAGFALRHLPAGSLKRVSLRRRLSTLVSAPRAVASALRLIKQRRPAAALSLGGYTAGPLVAACALLDVPLVVLEPNATPGLANRLAAPAARRTLLGHPAAASHFSAATSRVTGMPVRREFFRSPPKRPGSPFSVLILGGSQGAARLNRAALDAVRAWRARGDDVPRLVHQTGRLEYAAVSETYRGLGVEVEAAAFFDDMPRHFARADLVVCRAGASVIAELCAARKPAVLVPFPFAADDHQRANGAVLESAGGAVLVDDAEWTGDRMVREVDGFRQAPDRLAAMAAALAPLAPADAVGDAAAAVADAAGRAGGIG